MTPTHRITTWCRQLLDADVSVFGADGATEATEPATVVKALLAKTGELMLASDFLAGLLGRAGLLPSAER